MPKQLAPVTLLTIAAAEGATTPAGGAAGVWAWSSTLGRPVQWDGTRWKAYAPITVSTTAPAAPAVGDLWVDTN